ncbi:MAG TPA: FMN-binding glutamate synthase family protein [Methylovirgula sp.]|nr:FMN-binding glutamate synthase family protein [Methylovirgula sp.]
MRYAAFILSLIGCLIFAFAAWLLDSAAPLVLSIIFGTLAIIGYLDLRQKEHSLKRNYPILANLRFILEKIRPEIRQYFLESDIDGAPFNRSKRAIVYQRAKKQLSSRPFGTLHDVYEKEYEWLAHSILPHEVEHSDFRVGIGGPDCSRPYAASLLNISAMSFGALSAHAIMALNKGAQMGGFAHDTGEGSISPYHRRYGGDLIWELGSGYFGCRDRSGSFDPGLFAARASDDQVKMIEIKLSQGAKPGHGGILPAAKVTEEIALTRGIEVGKDCVSPARHPAFSTPIQMMEFIAKLRELSGGKPVGFKLCIGHPHEFMAICKAMIETGVTPDFIVIDGAEGGTGAAPLEFVDHVGTPLREGLTFARNCLIGAGLRDKIKIGASGRIITAFDIVRMMALGADWCNVARGFMFSLGCVQALACHTGHCPSGVATQNKTRQKAIDIDIKAERVKHFHAATLEALGEITGAAGLYHPSEFSAAHIMRRISDTEVHSFAEIYPAIEPHCLLQGEAPAYYTAHWMLADAAGFLPRSHVAVPVQSSRAAAAA